MNRLLALLFHQGMLDEQFLQLLQLEDETSPDFVSEVVNVYFYESGKLLKNLRALLVDREMRDYKKIEIHINQMMGSSSSIGANNNATCTGSAEEREQKAGDFIAACNGEVYGTSNRFKELFEVMRNSCKIGRKQVCVFNSFI